MLRETGCSLSNLFYLLAFFQNKYELDFFFKILDCLNFGFISQ